MLEGYHRRAGVVQETSVVLDGEDIILQLLAVGLDIGRVDVRTLRRGAR